MTKQDLLNVIEEFEKETWKYIETEQLQNDMMIIYKLENDIKKNDNLDINKTHEVLNNIFGVIRYKHGYEREIIRKVPQLSKLNEYIEKVELNRSVEELKNSYKTIDSLYHEFLTNIISLDFLENTYKDIEGKEGFYITLESLKSLVTNVDYRQLLTNKQIQDILNDYIKLSKEKTSIKHLEIKYDQIIKQIWSNSLSNGIDTNNRNFKLLFSNITGGNLLEHADLLINRPNHSSCSMVTSNFIATYGNDKRRIGFIYPNNSNIIAASAYDLGSNVEGIGITNKEKSSRLVTPDVLEKMGIERAKNNNDDVFFSFCYNEVLTDTKPCGVVIIGLGENNINIDYEDAVILSEKLNIPIYTIDTLNYKNELSERDKFYIAYHAVLSYFNLSSSYISQLPQDKYNEIHNIIVENQEEISKLFIILKNSNELNKNNMYLGLEQILRNTELQNLSIYRTR